jgi:hypothetical protein
MGTTIYSPWVVRGADNVRATLNVISVNSLTLTVRLFSRPLDASGDGTEVDSTRTIVSTVAGKRLQEWGVLTGNGLNEVVRYQFSTGSVVSPSAFVLFRMLQPVWFDTIRSIGSGIPTTGTPA